MAVEETRMVKRAVWQSTGRMGGWWGSGAKQYGTNLLLAFRGEDAGFRLAILLRFGRRRRSRATCWSGEGGPGSGTSDGRVGVGVAAENTTRQKEKKSLMRNMEMAPLAR